MGASKKMRTTRGAALIVEPSTGSDPITKACANATVPWDAAFDQVAISKTLRPSTPNNKSLRGRLMCIMLPLYGGEFVRGKGTNKLSSILLPSGDPWVARHCQRSVLQILLRRDCTSVTCSS